jgi:hypothetical protein
LVVLDGVDEPDELRLDGREQASIDEDPHARLVEHAAGARAGARHGDQQALEDVVEQRVLVLAHGR